MKGVKVDKVRTKTTFVSRMIEQANLKDDDDLDNDDDDDDVQMWLYKWMDYSNTRDMKYVILLEVSYYMYLNN